MIDAVFLIHDDAEILRAAQDALAPAAYRIRAYADLDAALVDHKTVRPQLLILPWYEAHTARTILSVLKPAGDVSSARVIVLVPRAQMHQATHALELGADDWVAVPFSPDELIARVSACLRRPGARAVVERLAAGPLAIDKAGHHVTIGSIGVELAPAEFRLLVFFLENQDRVFTRAELLRNAWERNLDAEPRTVDVHVRRLRKLLEPFGCDSLIQTVRGFGYRFSVPTASKPHPRLFPSGIRRPAM
jgi:two-component system phosphate regulon response regulator PhoB